MSYGNPIEKPEFYKHGYLITPSEIGSLVIAGQEDYVQMIIDGVIDWVLRYTGLNLSSEIRELLDGTNNQNLLLSEHPCQQLLECSIREYSYGNNWLDITEYCELLEYGELILNSQYYCFPKGTRNVRVRYISGLTLMPPLMKMTIIELVQLLLLKSGIIGSFGYNSDPEYVGGGGSTSSGTSSGINPAIKKVEIKNLAVTFSDEQAASTDISNSQTLRKAVIPKLIEDLLQKNNSLLTRLNIISRTYCH